MARMGPIRGEINILATSWTGEFSTRPERLPESDNYLFLYKKIPMKAIAAAATKKVTKSKENSAPDSILLIDGD